MTPFLGASLVVLSAWGAGRALLPSRNRFPRGFAEEQALAYLLGSAALVVAAMALTLLGLRFHAGLAWGLLLAGLAAGAWSLRRVRRDAPLAPSPTGRWSRPARALLAFLALGSIVATVCVPLNEFDPLLHFALKAKILYHTGDPLDEAFTRLTGDFGRIMTHPNYPLGIPFLEAFVAHAGGAWDERWVQLPLALWSACLPFAVAAGLRPAGPRAALGGALLAACVPMLYVHDFLVDWPRNLVDAGLGGSTILGGRADLPLAAFLAAACALLLRARRDDSLHTAALAGLCLGGGVMMKNEGLALFLILAIAIALGAFLLPGKRALKPTLLALGIGALAATPWLIHRSRLPSVDENYARQLTVGQVVAGLHKIEKPQRQLYGRAWVQELGNLDEIAEDLSAEAEDAAPKLDALDYPTRPHLIGEYFLREFLDLPSWGLLWILFWLSLPLGRERRRDPEARWLALLVLGGMAAYALILLVTPWYLPSLRMTGIPERLLLHFVGPVALLVGGALASAKPATRGTGTAKGDC